MVCRLPWLKVGENVEHCSHLKRSGNILVHIMLVELDSNVAIFLSINRLEVTLNLPLQKYKTAFAVSPQMQQSRPRQPILY